MSSRFLYSTKYSRALARHWTWCNSSVAHFLITPRHVPLSTSAHFGGFVNASRRANPTHHQLAGGISSPTLQPCRHLSKVEGKPKNSPPSRKPQPKKISDEPKESKESQTSDLKPHERIGLPDPVKGYPTPIVSQQDIQRYFLPLYGRGWSVDYRRKKDDFNQRYPVVSLQVYFQNLTWDAFFTLGKFVTQLQESEKHHGEWKLRDYGNALEFKALRLVGFDLPELIAFTIRTHSSIVSDSSKAAHEGWKAKGVVEGITLRDVRFAVLLDEMIEKHNTETTIERLKIRKDLNTFGERPKSLMRLLSEPETKEYPTKKKGRRKRKTKPVPKEFYIEDPGFSEMENMVPVTPTRR